MKISDLAVAPNLEILVLTACQNLVEVGSSLENLNKLTLLDVEDCQSLSNLPELPLSIKGLKLEGTGLRTLPSTIGRLTHFKKLSLRFCEQLESLPNSISSLSSFEELSLHQCSNLQKLPDDFGNLESLKELHAFNSGLRELPPSIQNIKVLRMLDLNGCMDLSKPPENFGNLESLEELDVSYTGLTELPPTIQNLNRLIKLYMIGCKELQSLPALPYNLGKFYARGRIRLLNRVSSSIMYQYFRKAHYQPTKYDGSSEMEYPFDRYQKSNEDYFYFISLERAPEVLLWNCSLECSFVQKVPFTLIDGNGRFTRNYGEEIIKCGIHPFFHS